MLSNNNKQCDVQLSKKRIALNGFGRIGRACFRAYFHRQAQGQLLPFEFVHVNDLEDRAILSHLLAYDTTYGRACPETVATFDGMMFSSESQLSKLEWLSSNVDWVIECTGAFRTHDALAYHLEQGAKGVLLGAPAHDDVDRMVVYGVSHERLTESDRIISNASCTTNAMSVLLKALLDLVRIKQMSVTEIHGYTSDQCLLDHAHRDPRRARSATQNMIPTQTMGLTIVDQILPELEGKISGYSMRVPVSNGACLNLTIELEHEAPTVQQINEYIKSVSGPLLGYNEAPLVSSDFVGRSESVVFDATQTRVHGKTLNLLAWFDNEYGYANRLLDLITYLCQGN